MVFNGSGTREVSLAEAAADMVACFERLLSATLLPTGVCGGCSLDALLLDLFLVLAEHGARTATARGGPLVWPAVCLSSS